MHTFIKVIFSAFLWLLFIFVSLYINISINKPGQTDTSILIALIFLLIVSVFAYYFVYPLNDKKSMFIEVLRYGPVCIILFMLFNISTVGFVPNHDRVKMSSIKSNMHTLQTVIETYSIDYDGIYPNNLLVLYKEANEKKYWKDFNNPLTGESGLDKSWMISPPTKPLDYNTATMGKVQPGAVIYDPIMNKGKITKYYIYGGWKKENTVISDNGKIFYMSNF